MSEKPSAPATERNSSSILGVLRIEFLGCRSVLEIGSGTGQHAVTFAAELPRLTWQTSDLDENHDGIHAWLDAAKLPNVHRPLSLDVMSASGKAHSYDGVYSSNTAHIMSYPAVVNMFGLVSRVLQDDGVFCLYGPFRQNGRFNTQSNANFHDSLVAGDPAMGIRDLEDLDALARDGGLIRSSLYAMPANNLLAVWRRSTSRRHHDGT